MLPSLIVGKRFQDARGILKYNNDFNTTSIKRIYTIKNSLLEPVRGWQGHKIEQRWFSSILGEFKIQLIAIDNWEEPSCNLKPFEYILNSQDLTVLHVPQGYISCITALNSEATLLIMADYTLGEIKDEYRYLLSQFNCTK